MLTPWPSCVPCTQVCTWSIAAEAADAADEEPRALMTAAPRCCTTGMKLCSIHSCVTRPLAALPLISACERSGYCVAEWLPQMVMRRMSFTWLAVFSASCESARL